MDPPEPHHEPTFLGRALPARAQSGGARDVAPREPRAFPRDQRDFPRWQEPDYRKAREEEDVVVAPFGRVPALPGVDVPRPPPFARPRQEVVTVDDDSQSDDREPMWDTRPSLFEAPRPKPRRRPKPKPIPRADEVIDVDALPDSAPPAPRPRAKPPAQGLDQPDARPRRLGRSMYDAVQTHGHFGMVDTGESDGCVRRLLVHVPKRSRGYVLDIHPGEVIHANSGRGRPVGGRLDVQYVTRHQYFAPGRAVTSCVIGVPDWQWQRFM
jgi:hypothetical protein